MSISLIFNFIRCLPQIIYFNFHYLPFFQAIKFPIWLYKPCLKKCGGTVRIDGNIRSGMIRMGFEMVSIYPNSGIIWENRGDVVFKGVTRIGNDSAITTGQNAKLEFGTNFIANCGFKLICYKKVCFSNNVLIGWNCLFSDNDFHTYQTLSGPSDKMGTIKIGSDNWFAMKSVCLKNTQTPNFAIIASNSLLNKDYINLGEKIMLSGIPAKMVKRGVYYDRSKDMIVSTQKGRMVDKGIKYRHAR